MEAARILALNLGSSSLKAALFERGGADLEGPSPRAVRRWELPVADVALLERDDAADQETLLTLLAAGPGQLDGVTHVVHRVVHGGELPSPQRLDEAMLIRLSTLSRWAPLHQPKALALVRAAMACWPEAESWADFDTDWHRSLSPLHRTLALPAELRARGLQRYGFHGLAFRSVYRQLLAMDAAVASRRLVLAHLGGGSSVCAVRSGRSLDTTMEVTPNSGLPMSTRSGSLDPGLILALLREGATIDSVDEWLNRRAGLLGVSETSGDMQTLLASSTPSARMAVDLYVLRVAQGIAAMAVSLGDIDDLVFSGGIGKHAAAIRHAIAGRLDWLGVALGSTVDDPGVQRIDAASARIRVWVVAVDEERELVASLDDRFLRGVHASSP